MNKRTLVLLLACIVYCPAREPFKPRHGSINFLVYFPSRYRGMCIGTLVSRAVVLTAAVCVTNPLNVEQDRRPITVVMGATYRHPHRGIRVQVTHLLIPRQPNVTSHRGFLMQKSPAVMLLKRRMPDALLEIPARAIALEWHDDDPPVSLHEECFFPGWHFFYKGDIIYPVHKFLLQRNMRVQFMSIVKKNLWCGALSIRFQKALTNLGFFGYFDKSGCICVKDPDRIAQPCHGMYGSPMICRGKMVGMMMAPDAQWTNCTGFSNLVHLLRGHYLRPFMSCVSRLFEPDEQLDWNAMKKSLHEGGDPNAYDYVPGMYGRLTLGSDSEETTSEEDIV